MHLWYCIITNKRKAPANGGKVENMTREQIMEILLADRCSTTEAKKYLNENRVIIYDNKDEFLEELNQFKEEDEELITIDQVRNGYIADTSVVEHEGNEYYIMYMN